MPAISSGFPLGRLIAALALAAGTVSCLGGQVFSLDPPELRRALKSGRTAFLAEVKDESLKQASRLGSGGAYYLSRHFSRLGQDDKAEILLKVEWESSRGLASEKSGRALMELVRLKGDWKNARSLSRAFLKRIPDDPDALFLELESLVRLGEYQEALGSAKAASAKAASAYGNGRAASVRACLAAAALLSGLKDGRAQIDAMIREERDGKAILLLHELLGAAGGEASAVGEASLLRARAYVAQRDYGKAAAEFKLLPEIFASSPGAAVISDSGKAFLFGGMAAEGAAIFSGLASRDAGADATGKALARLYAGRCLLQEGKKTEARLALRACLAEAPTGPEHDAAAWFLVDSLEDRGAAIDAVAATAPSWSDPGYFDDVVGELIRECLSRGEYRSLAELDEALSGRGSSSVGQRLAYILDRARSKGFLPKAAPSPSAASAAAGPGSYSYYAIMAAALLGRAEPAIPFARESEPSASGDAVASGDAEAFIAGLIDYGLEDEASAAVLEYQAVLEEPFLRGCAGKLADSGRHAQAARVAMVLAGKPGNVRSRADLELLYPRPWMREIEAAARESGMPANLLLALVRTESFFDPEAVSRSGAVGLSQLMADTAKDVAARLKIKDPDLRDPETNIRLGASYLARLLAYFDGDLVKALLSYNGGMGRVRAWAKQSPGLPSDLLIEASPIAETREYARKVLAALAVYGYLYDGLPMGDAVRGACPGLGGT